MDQLLLSIVVPIYNVDKYLRECIDSLLNQKINLIEIILIDDGSTDQSGFICDQYASTYSFIRVFHKMNGGVSSARNVGVRNASGKYITFVDPDDYIALDTYVDNLSYLESHLQIDMLQYPTCWNYGTPIEYSDKLMAREIMGASNIYEEWWRGDVLNYSLWNKIFRRSVFDNATFPEGHIFEDLYIIPDILKKIEGVYISEWGTYYYLNRETSLTKGKYPLNKHLDHFEAQFRNYQLLYSLENLEMFRLTAFLRVYRRLLTAKLDYEQFQTKAYFIRLNSFVPLWKDLYWAKESKKEKCLVALLKVVGLNLYMITFVSYIHLKKKLWKRC